MVASREVTRTGSSLVGNAEARIKWETRAPRSLGVAATGKMVVFCRNEEMQITCSHGTPFSRLFDRVIIVGRHAGFETINGKGAWDWKARAFTNTRVQVEEGADERGCEYEMSREPTGLVPPSLSAQVTIRDPPLLLGRWCRLWPWYSSQKVTKAGLVEIVETNTSGTSTCMVKRSREGNCSSS